MVVLDYLIVDTQAKTICAQHGSFSDCVTVSTGCISTPTLPGEYRVSTIHTNPIPVHPITGKIYKASKLGGLVIELEGTNMALHGWDNQYEIGVACSLSCVRIPQQFLNYLVFETFFDNVIVK